MSEKTEKSAQSQSHAVSAIANTVAAIGASAIVHPFDVIKTRLQIARVSNGAVPMYAGMKDATAHILKHEGVKGLYRGLFATVLAGGVSWGIFRYLMENVKQRLPIENKDQKNLASGFIAGGLATMCVHPLWLFKSRLEMLTAESKAAGWKQYRGVVDCATSIFKEGGIKGLYTGIRPALLSVPHSALQMFLYEKLKHDFKFEHVRPSELRTAGGHTWADPKWDGMFEAGRAFIWGAGSKLGATTITYPAQVLRSYQQMPGSLVAHDSLLKVVKFVLAQEGWRGMYRGFSIHIQRACAHSGLLFCFYEFVMKKHLQRQ